MFNFLGKNDYTSKCTKILNKETGLDPLIAQAFIEDFKPLFKHLLDTHPGLEFLQATPEFQDRYADTVVMRIFFILDSNDDGKITWRDFKLSNLFDVFMQVSNENDINVVR